MRWVDDTPVKKRRRRRRYRNPSVTMAVAAAIILASLTLCGLLFINIPKAGNKTVAAADTSVVVETLAATEDDGSTEEEVRSDGTYSVKNADSLNDSGEVTNKNTESKVMESLMYAIAKQTVRPR